MNNSLAIIIPAYKPFFLKQALESLCCQTNKHFNVYIGDDSSPYDLYEIIKYFENQINVKYKRYSDNIGAENLVLHWNRCLELIEDENWVWIFSDDDLLDSSCVEKFYEVIKKDPIKYDVYRFNTRIIDDENRVLNESIVSPEVENSIDLAINILKGQRGNSMPDHIFSADLVRKNNGFIITKYAQAADWASSIYFSYKNNLRTISGPKVSWRIGEFNISGLAKRKKTEMLIGHLEFVCWLLIFFKPKISKFKFDELKCSVLTNLHWVIERHYFGVSVEGFIRVLWTLIKNNFNIKLILIFVKSNYRKIKLN